MKLNHTCFAFYGHITNRDSVIETLGLTQETSMQTLLYAAFRAWKLDFNQQVQGDYALVLPLNTSLASSSEAPLDHDSVNECFIASSAFSSFSLFYQATNIAFNISAHLNDYMKDALLDPVAIGQLFTQHYIVPPLTLVKGVRQLANGESQIWQIVPKTIGIKATCSAHKILTLGEKLNTAGRANLTEQKQSLESQPLEGAAYEEDVIYDEGSVIDPALKQLQKTDFNAFMALPALSRLLSEPVTHIKQLSLLETLLYQETDTYVSDSGCRVLGLKEPQQNNEGYRSAAQRNQYWDKVARLENSLIKSLYKRIFKSNLRRAFKAQRQTQLRLRQEYQTQMLSFKTLEQAGIACAQSELPSFDTWLDLSVRLPNVWHQERLMAQGLGKKIHFTCLDAGLIRHSLAQSGQMSAHPKLVSEQIQSGIKPAYFALDDDSLQNLFDAMQRLMMHGYQPVTHALFKIVPPLTASLIKQQAQRQKVEVFCMQSLTLDHLSRHLNCSLARA